MKHPATVVVLMLAAALVPSATAGKGPQRGAFDVKHRPVHRAGALRCRCRCHSGKGSGAPPPDSPRLPRKRCRRAEAATPPRCKRSQSIAGRRSGETRAGHVPAGPPDDARGCSSERPTSTGRIHGEPRHNPRPERHPAHPAPQPQLSAPRLRLMSPAQLSAAASTVGANNFLALAVVLVAVTAGPACCSRGVTPGSFSARVLCGAFESEILFPVQFGSTRYLLEMPG